MNVLPRALSFRNTWPPESRALILSFFHTGLMLGVPDCAAEVLARDVVRRQIDVFMHGGSMARIARCMQKNACRPQRERTSRNRLRFLRTSRDFRIGKFYHPFVKISIYIEELYVYNLGMNISRTQRTAFPEHF